MRSEPPLHPEARLEYRSAARWYRRRVDRRTADRFVAEAGRVLSRIARQPSHYGWYDGEFREAQLTGFPYVVIYRDRDLLVVAVAHTSREPDYWRDRV